MTQTREQQRLQENGALWKKWGPYLSERQWGTVREDYSQDGNAWNYFTHDQARSRTYRWGEDGLAGISDDHQVLCFALALWNGHDPILKERLFGLTNSEGNHGEDVKEYYFYLDSTPTHSYMKYLYKYPHAAYPYGDLIETNRRRGRNELEYELLDTGIFNEDRYFDVFVEYAKNDPEDLLIKISVSQSRAGGGHARCPADALVPQYVVVGGRRWQACAPARRAQGCERHFGASHRPALSRIGIRLLLLRPGRCAAALYRERDQQRAPVRRAECVAVCQRRHQQRGGERQAGGGQSRQRRHQGIPAVCAHGRTWRNPGRTPPADAYSAKGRWRSICGLRHDRERTTPGRG